jgi:hypothetical protein
MRVGGKVNDKDANHASYSNIVGCRKTILRRDFKPVRAQLFIPTGDLLALFEYEAQLKNKGKKREDRPSDHRPVCFWRASESKRMNTI